MPRRKTIGVPKASDARRATTSCTKRHYSRGTPCTIIKAEEGSPELMELAPIIKREEGSLEAMTLTPSTTQMEEALPEPRELAPITKKEEDSPKSVVLTPPSTTQTKEASPASSHEPEPERNQEVPSTPSNRGYDVHERQPLVLETERKVRVKLILYPPAPPPSPVFTIRIVLNT